MSSKSRGQNDKNGKSGGAFGGKYWFSMAEHFNVLQSLKENRQVVENVIVKLSNSPKKDVIINKPKRSFLNASSTV